MQNSINEEVNTLIREKKYYEAWEKVKYVGVNIEPNINNRYIIYNFVINKYESDKNKSFITFFKNYINYYKFSRNSTFLLTDTKSVIQKLKNEQISPSTNQTTFIENLTNIGV